MLFILSLGTTIIVSVLFAACNNVNAQTLESITQQSKLLGGGPQIIVGSAPVDIKVNIHTNKIYVANRDSNSVSVIDGNSGNTKTISVGARPEAIAVDDESNKIYVANGLSNTVSVIDANNYTKERDIPVGGWPSAIGVKSDLVGAVTDLIFVANEHSNTVSVIHVSAEHGFSTQDKVAAGIIFNVNPPNSGKIICDKAVYPTNIYLYVDAGTNCIAHPNKDFEFNTWVESPLTSRNSSIPLDSSGNLSINRYGVFTVNFKHPHQLTTEELTSYYTIIFGAISAAVAINGALLVIPGWRRAKEQRTHLEECIKMIDDDVNKSDKNTIEKKIIGYYVKGKLSEDHRQLLKDKISEYYGSATSEGAPFTRK